MEDAVSAGQRAGAESTAPPGGVEGGRRPSENGCYRAFVKSDRHVARHSAHGETPEIPRDVKSRGMLRFSAGHYRPTTTRGFCSSV